MASMALEERVQIPGRAELSAIAPNFIVRRSETGNDAWPFPNTGECSVFQLEARHESGGVLAFCRLLGTVPSVEVLRDLAQVGISDHEAYPPWQARKVAHPVFCQQLKMTARSGKLALTQMAAAKQDVFVIARLVWSGMPFFNRWGVDFKPGMRERTEQLLLAGLTMLQPAGNLAVAQAQLGEG